MTSPGGRPGVRSHGGIRLATAAMAAALLVTACQDAASPSPSASPDSTPGPTPTAALGEILHATGPNDLIFRFTEGGGLMGPGFFITETPIMSLYGDGTVLFRDVGAAPPDSADGFARNAPLQVARLTEAEIQEFLSYAIADAGLGVARPSYDGPGADLPTATFTLNANDSSKVVSVMALGMERPGDPDEAILAALANLGAMVKSYSTEVEGESVWVPDRWRGILQENPANPPVAWPWPDIAPTDFGINADHGAPQFPIRTMTPAEVDVLGLDGIEGGVTGLAFTGPDGKLYALALRPILPDETY